MKDAPAARGPGRAARRNILKIQLLHLWRICHFSSVQETVQDAAHQWPRAPAGSDPTVSVGPQHIISFKGIGGGLTPTFEVDLIWWSIFCWIPNFLRNVKNPSTFRDIAWNILQYGDFGTSKMVTLGLFWGQKANILHGLARKLPKSCNLP